MICGGGITGGAGGAAAGGRGGVASVASDSPTPTVTVRARSVWVPAGITRTRGRRAAATAAAIAAAHRDRATRRRKRASPARRDRACHTRSARRHRTRPRSDLQRTQRTLSVCKNVCNTRVHDDARIPRDTTTVLRTPPPPRVRECSRASCARAGHPRVVPEGGERRAEQSTWRCCHKARAHDLNAFNGVKQEAGTSESKDG